MELNNTNIVQCRICNGEMKVRGLGSHIVKIHKLTPELYYNKYINPIIGSCATCGIKTRFDSLVGGYKKHCSHKCSLLNPSVKLKTLNKTKEALLIKYGVENPSQIPGYSDKVKKTKLDRYGNENYNNTEKNLETNFRKHNGIHSSRTKENKIKVRNTCLEKYGVEHFTKTEWYNEDTKKRNLDKYGVEYTLQVKEVRDKITETCNQRYGGVLMGSPMLSGQIKNTNIERYGSAYPTQNKIVMNKIKNTNLIRYGKTTVLQNSEFLMNMFGVTDINKLKWVTDKSKDSRIKTLKERYNVTNSYQTPSVLKRINDKYGVDYVSQVPEILNRILSGQNRLFGLKKILVDDVLITYQSKTELKFINYCIDNNIKIFNGDSIPYRHNDKDRIYHIDFKIIDDDNKYRLIEIKGTTIFHVRAIKDGSFNAKCNAASQYSLDNNYLDFKVLFDNDIDELIKLNKLSK